MGISRFHTSQKEQKTKFELLSELLG